MLTEALAKGVVPRADIPASLPRQLLRVVGTPFVEVWGPVERSATEEQAYARYRAVLNDNAMARRGSGERPRPVPDDVRRRATS